MDTSSTLKLNRGWAGDGPKRVGPDPAPRDLAILDCPHVFDGRIYVRTPGGWLLITFANKPEGGCNVMATHPKRPPAFCDICGQALDDSAPTRNYVVGGNVPVDEHLQMLHLLE